MSRKGKNITSGDADYSPKNIRASLRRQREGNHKHYKTFPKRERERM